MGLLVGLAVTELDPVIALFPFPDPIDLAKKAGIAYKQVSLAWVGDVEDVVGHVFAVNEEGPFLIPFDPADAKPLMLADRVIEDAHMLPDDLPARPVDYLPRGGREVVMEELAEVPFPDEADAGRVLFVHDRGEPKLVGEAPDLAFFRFRKGEKAAIDLGFA